jgi:signal transduction histidine kinase
MRQNKHLRIRINESQLKKIIDNVIQNPDQFPTISTFVRSSIDDKLVVGHQDRGLTLPGEKNI